MSQKLGKLIFWLSWPVLGLYLKNTKRTRVLVTAGDHVLLVKSWLSDDRWLLPGGGLHRGETAVAAARRELAEETGLEVAPELFKSLGALDYQKHGFRFRHEFFSVELPLMPELHPQPREIIAANWLSWELLGDRSCGSDVRTALIAARPKR